MRTKKGKINGIISEIIFEDFSEMITIIGKPKTVCKLTIVITEKLSKKANKKLIDLFNSGNSIRIKGNHEYFK